MARRAAGLPLVGPPLVVALAQRAAQLVERQLAEAQPVAVELVATQPVAVELVAVEPAAVGARLTAGRYLDLVAQGPDQPALRRSRDPSAAIGLRCSSEKPAAMTPRAALGSSQSAR